MLWSQKTRRATGLLLHRIPTLVHPHFYPVSFCSQIPRCPRTSQIPAPGDSRRPAEGAGVGGGGGGSPFPVLLVRPPQPPPLATPWAVTGMNHPPPAAGVTQWSGQPARPPAATTDFPSSRGQGVGASAPVGAGGLESIHPPSTPPPTGRARWGAVRAAASQMFQVGGTLLEAIGASTPRPNPGRRGHCGTRARSPLAPTRDSESPEKRAAGE